MKKLTTNTGVKIIAAILLIICIFLLAFSIVGTFYIYESGILENPQENYYDTDGFIDDMIYQALTCAEEYYYTEIDDGYRSFEGSNIYTSLYRSEAIASGDIDASQDENTPADNGILTPEAVPSGASAAETLLDSLQRLDKDRIAYYQNCWENSQGIKIIDIYCGSDVDIAPLGTPISANGTDKYADTKSDYIFIVQFDNGYISVSAVKAPVKYIDYFLTRRTVHNIFYRYRNVIILIDILFSAIIAALAVFLIISAGRRPYNVKQSVLEDENSDNDSNEMAANPSFDAQAEKGYTIKARFTDRIPADIFFFLMLIIYVATLSGGICIFDELYFTSISLAYTMIMPAVLLTAASAATLIAAMMSFSVRFKLGKWWRNSLIYRLYLRLKQLVCKCFSWIFGSTVHSAGKIIKKSMRSIGMQWKLTAGFIIIALINFALGAVSELYDYYSYSWGFLILLQFICVLFDIAALIVILGVGLMMQVLKKGGQAIADGDANAKIETGHMIWDFKEHAENLNSISSGMMKAVDEKLKSERLKTELITNVSHDIKTPLTSIVNYVDLLKKENPGGRAGEYIDVLDRQSQRLKKLTEDLIEASKASTGNISVSLSKIDICEIVNQSVAEYEEKLKAADIDAVIETPETPVMAKADGRLLWRTIDNLLSNVCKYSLPGTRMYIIVTDSSAAQVTIHMKNISRERLNIDAGELMERFVRGDSSRTTEGSGLGLNIARSLTELQGGLFSIYIDGDLFKAEIILKK